MQNFLLRSVYDYQDNTDKDRILTFFVGEHFVLIKESDATEWYYVINQHGQIGYVPNPYVVFEEVCFHIFVLFLKINFSFFFRI